MRRRGKPGPQRDLREFEIGQTRAPHSKSGQHQQTIRFAHGSPEQLNGLPFVPPSGGAPRTACARRSPTLCA